MVMQNTMQQASRKHTEKGFKGPLQPNLPSIFFK